jgi:hypothetical protein
VQRLGLSCAARAKRHAAAARLTPTLGVRNSTTMTREDRILAALATGRRLCDDCLSDVAGVKPRQSVSQACSALRQEGVLTRLTESCEACNRMKITNGRLLKPDNQRPRAQVAESGLHFDVKRPGPLVNVSVNRPRLTIRSTGPIAACG